RRDDGAIRPKIREQRFGDCASLDWPVDPHQIPSCSGHAPTADRSKTSAGRIRVEANKGLTTQGPLQKPAFLTEVHF
ncbi:MAG: hypothetical protein KGS44_07185, partial [Alphaproteobacteria bacterium]|nr:hypothetical protein [Alphaproteobacteria bacterium]